MALHPLPRSVAIIGAGPAGLFAARRLRQLGVKEITLIEKEERAGGKCSTYFSPQEPNLKAERGATVIAPNYGVVIDAMLEKGIKTEQVLSVKNETVEIFTHLKRLNFFQQLKLYPKLAGELWRFCSLVKTYKRACAKLHPLPHELELPFSYTAEKYRLETLNLLLKPLVTGFGYGDLHDCPTYSVLEYMGYMTIPFLVAEHFNYSSCELRSICGGFQHLMQKVAEDFNLLTSTDVIKIKRDASGIKIDYRSKSGSQEQLKADALITAVSPKHWEGLFGRENLTQTEIACIDQLTYYRYPVLICKLKGFPPNFFYKPEALNKEKFGHIAFVSTMDKRENPSDGRLCSAYINLSPINSYASNLHDGCPVREQILADLKELPGVTHVEIIECKIWEDYFSTLPWKIRLDLEKQQYCPSTKTLYVGSYALGSFEDVASVANQATAVVNHCFHRPISYWQTMRNDFRRFFQYSNLH